MIQTLTTIQEHIGYKTQALIGTTSLTIVSAADKQSAMHPYFAYIWNDGTYWIPATTMLATVVSAFAFWGIVSKTWWPWTKKKYHWLNGKYHAMSIKIRDKLTKIL